MYRLGFTFKGGHGELWRGQRQVTKRLGGRLRELGMFSLEKRRLRGHMKGIGKTAAKKIENSLSPLD